MWAPLLTLLFWKEFTLGKIDDWNRGWMMLYRKAVGISLKRKWN